MINEKLKNQIIELKENCKKLAEEYRERYNQDNENKIALNMFYHNVISYNDYESVLALIENRNSMIMCFSAPPVLTEETVEINLKRIAELEKENAELKTIKIPQLERKIASIRGAHSVDCRKLNARTEQVERLKKENAELKKEIKDNEDLATVAYMQGADSQKKKAEKQLIKAKELEKENAELNKKLSKAEADYDKMFWNKNEIISKTKEIIRMVVDSYKHKERFSFEKDLIKAEQFLNSEAEK
jgi:hypothetical protein